MPQILCNYANVAQQQFVNKKINANISGGANLHCNFGELYACANYQKQQQQKLWFKDRLINKCI